MGEVRDETPIVLNDRLQQNRNNIPQSEERTPRIPKYERKDLLGLL